MLRGSYAGGSLNVTARRPCRRPGPSAILHARVQAPVARLLRYPCGAFPAKLRPRHSRLCYSSAHQCYSLPLRCRAGLRHRVILHFKAVAWQISEELCLSIATLRFAFATLCSAKQRLRCPHQSIAVACRGFASPLPHGALLCVTVAVRCRSWPSYPMPLRIGSLPVLRGAVRFLAHPSPIAPMLCRRLRAALPCSSLAALDIAMPILRRSRLSRAFPSPHRANQSVSFAESRNAFPSQLSA